jgi:short-chain fatty acids transporter
VGRQEAEPEQPKPSVEGRKPKRRGVMQSLTAMCVRYVERLMPDPYLFAVILTLIVAALVALLVNGAAPSGMLKAWYGGVWGSQNIFTFAFQMVLILVTGYTLAEAPVLKRAIVYIASKPRNQVQGALLCFGVSASRVDMPGNAVSPIKAREVTSDGGSSMTSSSESQRFGISGRIMR